MANKNSVERMTKDPEFFHTHVQKYYDERVEKSWKGDHILRGSQPKDGDIVMTSNDYLGISNHPRMIEAEKQILSTIGHGSPQSRIFGFHLDNLHRQFELRMAEALGTEDCVLFQSGYDANLCLMESIAAGEHPVYVDTYAHASLFKGCQSAEKRPTVVKHNDPNALRKKIASNGQGVVVVDAIYSTTGARCKLAEIVEVCNELNCVLAVDETHSFGLHGPRGYGLTKSLGLENSVHFQVVGLSKSFASRGGVVAGTKRNIEFVRNHGFPGIFSTQVMTHEVAGYNAALDIIEKADDERQIVHELHRKFRGGCDEIGFNVGQCDHQIVSIESGLESTTIKFRDFTQSRGLFGFVYAWPATSMKRSLIRFRNTRRCIQCFRCRPLAIDAQKVKGQPTF